MVAGDVVHPDNEVVDVQADPQNERNTVELARPAVPDGQVVSLCGCPLGSHPPWGDGPAREGASRLEASRGEGAGVNRLSGNALKQVETGLCRLSGGVKSNAVGLCRHLVLSSVCDGTVALEGAV